MQTTCPGWLFAKTLTVGGACEVDYIEWFAHEKLTPYLSWIRAAGPSVCLCARARQPVLMLRELVTGEHLVFRFAWDPRGDQRGRTHVREEVLLVPTADLPYFLSGDFVATANRADQIFSVEACEPARLPLPFQESTQICGNRVRILAAGADAYTRQNTNSANETDSADSASSSEEGDGSSALTKLVWFWLLLFCLAGAVYCWWASSQ